MRWLPSSSPQIETHDVQPVKKSMPSSMPVFPPTSQLNLFQQPPGRLLFKSHWSGHMLILYPQGSLGKQVSGLFRWRGGMDSMSGVNIILQRRNGSSERGSHLPELTQLRVLSQYLLIGQVILVSFFRNVYSLSFLVKNYWSGLTTHFTEEKIEARKDNVISPWQHN